MKSRYVPCEHDKSANQLEYITKLQQPPLPPSVPPRERGKLTRQTDRQTRASQPADTPPPAPLSPLPIKDAFVKRCLLNYEDPSLCLESLTQPSRVHFTFTWARHMPLTSNQPRQSVFLAGSAVMSCLLGWEGGRRSVQKYPLATQLPSKHDTNPLDHLTVGNP